MLIIVYRKCVEFLISLYQREIGRRGERERKEVVE